MSELLPEDELLLRDARVGLEPTSEDRERIKRALFAQLGVAVGTTAATATAKSVGIGTSVAVGAKTSSAIVVTMKIVGALLVVGSIVGASVVAIEKSHAPPASVIATSSPATSTSAASSIAIVNATPSDSSTPPDFEIPDAPTTASPTASNSAVLRATAKSSANTSASPTASGPSTVAAEAQLLREAHAALQSGDAKLALSDVDQHATSFPNGVLSEDREALRVSALCALGRITEAKKVAAAFLQAHPSSPHATHVRASCGEP